ncbi:uncharacterized protein CEXT_470531 [Caerostris extrusa]|uniref:Apple domain-containing protein n=1 Tax=Caerostris extrusa TaxID=172846 RepID=A0AAV4TVE5_CAEEX|nr:uncharacterized protein CEXT_470531 [Caerostris extrusa]
MDTNSRSETVLDLGHGMVNRKNVRVCVLFLLEVDLRSSVMLILFCRFWEVNDACDPFQMRILLLCLVSLFFHPPVLSSDCSKPTFARRLFVRFRPDTLPSVNVVLVHESPPSECYEQCISDRNCSAYFVDYRNSSCQLIQGLGRDLTETELVRDEDSSYHRKVCLPNSQCDHEWDFDEIQGVQLFQYLDKTVTGVNSSDACMILCQSEVTFVCRSARFDSSKSECVLSRHDRRTASEVFRPSPNLDSVLYMERQCVQEPQGCQFRSRQSRAIARRHRHVQIISNITSRTECEAACLESAPFTCRSYQYGGEPAVCLLSPEDSNSDPGSLEPSMKTPNDVVDNEAGGVYFEKESCIDVDIECGPSAMTVIVRVSTPFRGRVYAAGHPYECYSVSVSDDGRVSLSMPLHSRHCGTQNLPFIVPTPPTYESPNLLIIMYFRNIQFAGGVVSALDGFIIIGVRVGERVQKES